MANLRFPVHRSWQGTLPNWLFALGFCALGLATYFVVTNPAWILLALGLFFGLYTFLQILSPGTYYEMSAKGLELTRFYKTTLIPFTALNTCECLPLFQAKERLELQLISVGDAGNRFQRLAQAGQVIEFCSLPVVLKRPRARGSASSLLPVIWLTDHRKHAWLLTPRDGHALHAALSKHLAS